MVKQANLFEDGSVHEIHEYVLDENGYWLKDISTWVVTTPWLGDSKPGDIRHDVIIYDRDEHGSLLKQTGIHYADEDMSIPEETRITYTCQYKYDTHGNVIYEKYSDGHEYKYEITYY